jgi:hypothetical protein
VVNVLGHRNILHCFSQIRIQTGFGPLFGNPHTGKRYMVTGFDLFRISDDKFKELGSSKILLTGNKSEAAFICQLQVQVVIKDLLPLLQTSSNSFTGLHIDLDFYDY